MGAWKTIRQSHRPEDCPDAIPNSAAEYRGGAGITEGVGATGDAPAPEPRCDACGGPDGRVSAKYTDDGSDIYLCEACDGRGWIVQGANCTACSGTGHATRNRVFATDEERMEYVCASHIGETSGRTTPNSTDTLGDVQDAVFLWSCESLTAEQAMEMILRALHA
jgi:DnaJ-class molecular chaperone